MAAACPPDRWVGLNCVMNLLFVGLRFYSAKVDQPTWVPLKRYTLLSLFLSCERPPCSDVFITTHSERFIRRVMLQGKGRKKRESGAWEMTYFRDEINGFVTMAGKGRARHASLSTKCVETEVFPKARTYIHKGKLRECMRLLRQVQRQSP